MIEQTLEYTAPQRTRTARAVRKDIQALRALAVGLVVLNHLWPDKLTGGYVGVDVFFVISGFLISTHLLVELKETGRIALGRFYARRIKRLLPAATLVSVLSLVAAWLLLPFSRWFGIAQETLASVLYIENWLLAAKSVNYSSHNDAASTVQHYWSLSVEEQFYLVWPLLLIGLAVAARRYSPVRAPLLFSAVGLLSVLSLAYCVWFTYTGSTQAYFVTPARVWEFGAGAMAAIVGLRQHTLRHGKFLTLQPQVSGTLQWLGYGLVIVAAFKLTSNTPFPGIAATLPVLGALLVIMSGPEGPVWSPDILLRAKPVQVVGGLSYSLYLWHWPLIVLAPSVLGTAAGVGNAHKAAILVVSFGLAYVTKRFVEDPNRGSFGGSTGLRGVFIKLAAAMLAVCALCGALLIGLGKAQEAEAAKLQSLAGQPCYGARSLDQQSCPDPFGPAQVNGVSADESPWFNAKECAPAADPIVVQGRTLLVDCDFTSGEKPTATVWLVGDSHAEQWKAAIYELARHHKWKVRESLLGGCPFIDVKRVAFKGAQSMDAQFQQQCLEWGRQVTSRVIDEKPDILFVSSFSAGETVDDGTRRPQHEQYSQAVASRFTSWAESGAAIYVLRDTPLTLQRSSPDCVELNKGNPVECANPRSEALVADPVADAARAMRNPKIRVIDLSDQFCTDMTCHAVIGGLPVYYDTDHIARSYMHSMVPMLAQRFNEASMY
ncbi:peptidoglycan/LPS O-acetylase OafA/YrhL [Arthrobacter sp. B2I5]|uniref:acyltransferase family protein n=1 Tax=Arthrobacter sp. B2I5 TaxID=3042266 RepID=UPI002786E936|nr:acyltransferase family protein [Arthrobacter sp. B2I5]MDQ0825140.1 peptidoglycan/LPS O-acetylase OafA/YrhL [Arthrobacter sp. B2I5]